MLHLIRRRRFGIALVAVLGSSACTDHSTGASSRQLTLAQHNSLTTLLTRPAIASSMLTGSSASAYTAALLPFIAMNIQNLGSFTVTTSGAPGNMSPPPGEYRAFGGQFLVTITPPGGAAIHLVWTGVIGVNDLTHPTDVITVGVIDDGASSAVTSIGTTPFGSSGPRSALSSYIHLNGDSASKFTGTSGQVTISSAAFSGGSTCPGAGFLVGMLDCSFSTGTLQGSFGFTGTLVGGATTVSIPATTVNLPATRVVLAIAL